MGYEQIELKYRVSPTIPIPLLITFPEGSELGLTRSSTKMIISCKADVPTSWSGKIEFYDTDGERFSIEVSGCTDNSLFMNYSFVRNYSDRYGFVAFENEPVQFLTKKQIHMLKTHEVKVKALQRKMKTDAANQTAPEEGKKSD